jgi:xylulokinase
MLDLHTNRWSEEMLQAANLVVDSLPEIAISGTNIGPVTREASNETGLPEGAQVVLGGHDHLCGALAAGVLLGKRVLDSSGTAESIVGFSEIDQRLPKKFYGLRLGRYLDPRRFVTWGGIIASGKSMDWGIDHFASLEGWGVGSSRIDYDMVNAIVEKAPVGCRALLYLPHIRGCGAPHWNPRARGAIVGLRDTHTQAEFMRAVIEGICFEARLILEITQEVFGASMSTLNTIGGGTRSAVWQQIKADVTGKEVEVPEVEEATAMGAALLAGIGVGVYRDQLEASQKTHRLRTRYAPNQTNKDAYNSLYAVYRQLYDVLLSVNSKLSEIQGGLPGERAGV